MKTIFTKSKAIILTVMLCITVNLSYAQVIDLMVAGTNRFGRVNPVPGFNASAIGIGNFTASPSAAFHINTNLLPTNNTFATGEVFRTDCPILSATNTVSAWRMLVDGSEIGGIFNNYNGGSFVNDLTIQSSKLNSRIIFNTGGAVSRMIITDGVSPAIEGYVGIGKNFTLPRSLLHLNDGAYATNLQITNNSTGTIASDGFKVGIDLSGIAVLNQQENEDMLFNTGAAINNVSRMVIKGQAASNQGFVGIGSNFISPIHLLDVYNGDINIGDAISPNCTKGYMLGDNYVLRHNGILSNIYVGVGAGNSNSSGVENTIIGCDAGNHNTSGEHNTFVGHVAGHNNTSGFGNTFVGDSAGFSNQIEHDCTFIGVNSGFNTVSGWGNTFTGSNTGYFNTIGIGNVFTGVEAGFNNTIGRWNTFTGNWCGFSNTTAWNNSFYGKHCGASNTTGNNNSYYGTHAAEGMIDGNDNVMMGFMVSYYQHHGDSNVIIGDYAGYNATSWDPLICNTFIGFKAGVDNYTGNFNTYLGYQSGNSASTYPNSPNYSSAIGVNAKVVSDYKMILGDNNINVGIGLSDDNNQGGPQNKLEIDAGLNGTSAVGNGVIGASGLRFRDLHSGTNTVNNPGNGVLSVDEYGDVIYVPASGGGFVNLFSDNGTTISPSDQWTTSSHVELGGFLHKDTEVRLFDPSSGAWNLYFAGQAAPSTLLADYIKQNVGIGIPVSSILQAKLDVLQESGISAYSQLVPSNEYSIGINLLNTFTPVPDGMECIGIKSHVNGYSISLGGRNNIAGKFIAENASFNVAGMFRTPGIGTDNYGIKSIAENGSFNYGIWAKTNQNQNDWAGYFVGNVYITGSYGPSDSKLKENTSAIVNAIGLISQLQPHTFNYDTLNYSFMSLPKGMQFGIYADEADSIIPELVTNIVFPEQFDSLGNIISPAVKFKGLNYTGLIPITIQAIKELDSTVTALQNMPSGGVQGAGTPNYLTKWNANADSITSSIIADNGATISIGSPPQGNALFRVYSNHQPIGFYTSNNSDTPINDYPLYPVYPYNQYAKIPTVYGSRSSAFSSAALLNVGNYSSASGEGINIGGLFLAGSTDPTANSNTNMGVFAHGYGNNTNYGVYSIAQGGITYPNPSTNYALYAAVNSFGTDYPGSTNYAGYFSGDVVITGGLNNPSDQTFKNNISSISDPLDIIDALQPHTFNYNRTDFPYMNFSSVKQYGLTAQEVETVLPELVTENIHPEQKDTAGNVIVPELSYKGVNYEQFIPILIAGMKEQQETINDQQSEIDSLKDQLLSVLSLIGANNKTSGDNKSDDNQDNIQYVELETLNAIILNQNDPNPFAEETDISYFLPDDVSDAKIMFYDNLGKIIKTVELLGKGNGSLHVYASNLSAGIYSYSLIADGKVIDTKKMMKSK